MQAMPCRKQRETFRQKDRSGPHSEKPAGAQGATARSRCAGISQAKKRSGTATGKALAFSGRFFVANVGFMLAFFNAIGYDNDRMA